jgi:hypothetical protein
MDQIWTLVGFILTLLVLSYLFGDNPLFRFTSYLFIGVTAGYVVTIVFYQVLWPRLLVPLVSGDSTQIVLVIVPILLSILMLTKLSTRFASLGNASMAYLVGVGAAVAIGGAVVGTLIGQTRNTVELFNLQAASSRNIQPVWMLLQGFVFLLGTICTLAYFQYSGFGKKQAEDQPAPKPSILIKLGRAFIAITLGAIFAGVYAAAVTALIERLDFLKSIIFSFFGR